ncbi:MAG: mechanosensitive ion channel family protein [Bacteroidota bacterium]
MQTTAASPDTASVSDSAPLGGEPPSVTDALGSVVDKVTGWIDSLILLLPNFVVAILIVVVAAVIARLVRSGVRSLLERATGQSAGARNVIDLLGTLAYVAVLAGGTFIALGVLGADSFVTTLLAGAGVVGLALGFAFQDIASNFIAGVLMAVRNPFTVGQLVETNGHMGIVQSLDLRSTVIETFQGQMVIIPNAKVFQEPLINYSEKGIRRVDISCGVGYGDDLAHAQQVAVKAVEGLELRLKEHPVKLFYTEFGDSSINFALAFWVTFDGQADFLQAQSDAIQAIKTAFDAEGVTIPFPIRTLDFDPNGGVPLTKMLGTSGQA